MAVVVVVSGSRDDPRAAFAGPPPPTATPDCSVTSWDWESGNCFGLEGLWHHETSAEISGMSGGMLAFNQNCSGSGVSGCEYATGVRVSGRAVSPAFAAVNGAVLTFKTARETEENCPATLDLTIVRYSTNSGLSFSILDVLATGSITAGGQELDSGGGICGNDLTTQTVKVKLPPGTTNIAFEFDSIDSLGNFFAGQFIDDVVVSACGAPACPTQTRTDTPTFTVTPTFTATATHTQTPTPTNTPTVTPTATDTPKGPPPTKMPPTPHIPEAAASLSLDTDCDSSTDEAFEPQSSDNSTFLVCVFGNVPSISGYNLRVEWDSAKLAFDDSLTPADYDSFVEACSPPLGAVLNPLTTGTGFLVVHVEGAANATCPAQALLSQLAFACIFDEEGNNHGGTNITLTGPGVDTYLIDTGGPDIKPSLRSGVVFCLDPTVDSDNDGCTNGQELGTDETTGGLRNPMYRWDYYDVLGPGAALPTDGVIDLPNDILSVILHFSPAGAPPYDVRFDRGPSAGPNPWNMGPPDGVIDLPNDILGVILQFGHDCG